MYVVKHDYLDGKNELYKLRRFSVSLDRLGQNLPNSNWDIVYREACTNGRAMVAH